MSLALDNFNTGVFNNLILQLLSLERNIKIITMVKNQVKEGR